MQLDPYPLLDCLKQFPEKTVLCIGDVMLDRFSYGAVDRISPESPIPVFFHQRDMSMLGGAGNAANNIVALGAKAILIGVVGDDADGLNLCSLVGEKMGHASQLITESNRKTTVKQRFVSGTQQMLRADYESVHPISALTEKHLLQLFDKALPKADAIILSDYGKGVLTDAVLAHVISAAKAAGKPIALDPKRTNYAAYTGVTFVTPNRKELQAASGMKTDSEDEIIAAARHLINTYDIQFIIATRSREGMSIITKDTVQHVPTWAREVWDVSGAGDTVIATISAALATKVDLLTAARLANVAAGVVVGKVGTATATPDEIYNSLNRDRHQMHEKSLIMTIEQAQEQVERWRSKNRTIGMTCGVFDILHPGHIATLRQARQHCDKLIVAINTDASVRRLNKGPERPINPELSRALVMAAIDYVDMVVLFDEDTELKTAEALKPDMFIKGGDYNRAAVVCGDFVESYGGKIIFVPLEEGLSTTNIVNKLKASA